jgi:DNA-binding LacI/PurR family transcriptional regulator
MLRTGFGQRREVQDVPKKATFREVAKRAGVSAPTVSRLVTGRAYVSPQIAERVKSAARQLGVDLFRGSRSKVIVFVLSNRDMLRSFHAHILAGTEAYCAARGWNTLFLTFRYQACVPWKELHLPPILERRDAVSGFVVAGTNFTNLLELLNHKDIPFAVLGNNVVGEWKPDGYDVVWFDDIQGAYEITQHMLSLGHRDLWYVGNMHLPWYARRYQGYARAMEEAGISPCVSHIESDNNGDIGFLATKSILARRQRVTAIFAGADCVAEGVYRALRDSGLSVPQHVSVAGFDDIEASFLHPHLTTVRVFTEQIGKCLAEMVLTRIESPGKAFRQLTIPTQLVRRDSCEPPSAAKETYGGEPSAQP